MIHLFGSDILFSKKMGLICVITFYFFLPNSIQHPIKFFHFLCLLYAMLTLKALLLWMYSFLIFKSVCFCVITLEGRIENRGYFLDAWCSFPVCAAKRKAMYSCVALSMNFVYGVAWLAVCSAYSIA